VAVGAPVKVNARLLSSRI